MIKVTVTDGNEVVFDQECDAVMLGTYNAESSSGNTLVQGECAPDAGYMMMESIVQMLGNLLFGGEVE